MTGSPGEFLQLLDLPRCPRLLRFDGVFAGHGHPLRIEEDRLRHPMASGPVRQVGNDDFSLEDQGFAEFEVLSSATRSGLRGWPEESVNSSSIVSQFSRDGLTEPLAGLKGWSAWDNSAWHWERRLAGAPRHPNRRTADVIDRLNRLGCDPIEGTACIAMDPENAPELRGRMFAELAQHVAPKRRALDMNSQQSTPVTIRIGIPQKPDQAQSTDDTR